MAPSTYAREVDQRQTTACSLDADQLDEQVGEWESVLAHAVERTQIDGGLRVRLDSVSAARVADLAEREQKCCAFFAFAVIIDASGVSLEVRAPAEARPILLELFG